MATSRGQSFEDPPRVAEVASDYPAAAPEGLRLIAQLRNRYLLCETEDRVYLLDRARADEVLRLARLAEAAATGTLTPQALLFPDRLELDAAARTTLKAHEALLAALGFEWSTLGDDSYVIRAIPAHVGTTSARKVFTAAIDALHDDQTDPDKAVLEALARASAIAPGEPMDRLRALEIVARLSLERSADKQSIIAEFALPDETRQETP